MGTTELLHPDSGAKIHSASAFDPRYPPSNILDSKENTFWTSTGIYPQEFVLQLGGTVNIEVIRTVTRHVKTLVVQACDGPSPIVWKTCLEKDLEDGKRGQPQTEIHQLKSRVTANFLKFRIMSGHEDFSTVHTLSLQG